MKPIKAIAIGMSALMLAGCIDAPMRDKTRDYGIDRKDLSQLRAGIWVDPQGCDHWIIDDGAEVQVDSLKDRSEIIAVAFGREGLLGGASVQAGRYERLIR